MSCKTSYRVALVLAVLLGFLVVPAVAQETRTITETSNYWKPLIAVGAGIVTLGAALGIGRLAAAAMEGTARQPEAGGQIRTTMIIAAALIEGFTFFALIVCFMAL